MRRSLSKQERLRSRDQIGLVLRDGKNVRTSGLRLAYRPNGETFNRIVVIPAKGFRTAVARNKCRRQTREAFRALKPDIVVGFDIVIVAYRGDFAYSDRLTQLAGLLTRAQLLVSGSVKEL